MSQITVPTIACAVLVPALAATLAHGQVAPDDSTLWPVDVDSGVVVATGPEPEVVFSTIVAAPNAPWVRLKFEDVSLPAGANRHDAWLRITSLADGAQQTLDATTLSQWGNSSAYFNGDAVELELIASNRAGSARVRITGILAGPPMLLGDRHVCDGIDERVPSNDPRAARLQPGTCTAWLINDECGCFLTAGHCMTGSQFGRVAQFNVPLSTSGGGAQHPPPEDQYPLDPESVQTNFGLGVGNDWAVFGCYPNSNTGLSAAAAQGTTYELAPSPVVGGPELRITGYGSTGPLGGSPDAPLEWNLAQKTLAGPLVLLSGSTIRHGIDTTGGNSGSPITDELSGLAIGIHTHGSCLPDGAFNGGTTIDHPDLVAALAAPRGVCAGAALATIDETAKLTAPDAAAGDRFATAVATDGQLIAAGSPRDDDRGSNSGAVYLYRREGDAWVPELKLLAADGMAGDQLGLAVGVDADVVAASAAGSAGSITTPFLSRVYLFRNQPGEGWVQEATLSPSETAQDDWFGLDLALHGQTVIVGAPRDASGPGAIKTGAAWIYTHDGSGWSAGERLVSNDAEAFDQFGFAVDLRGDAAVIGAPFDDDADSASGSAYIFRREPGGAWVQEAKLVAPDGQGGDQFGMAVAIADDVAVITTPRETSAGPSTGAAYVFRRTAGVWSFETKLTAPDANPGDEFGASVSLDGSTLLIGAAGDSIDGVQSGSAYLFRHTGAFWAYAGKFAATDGASADQFGAAVAIAGSVAVAGAPQDDDAGSASGSAYVFSAAPPCAADLDDNGAVDVFDLLAYLDLWFASSLAADLNGDSVTDVFDLLAYLDMWFQGC